MKTPDDWPFPQFHPEGDRMHTATELNKGNGTPPPVLDAAQQAELAINTAAGRKDKDGTEAVIKLQPLKKAISELETLKNKSDQARDKLNDAVKAVAEQSGLLSSVVRKLVNARCGENFAEEKTKAEQLAMVFGEVGLVSGSK
jgi:hypothetical protein